MRRVNFMSDNTAGADPAVLAALKRANWRDALAYGDDDLSHDIERRIAALFETEADVFLVSTGTAANALSLAAITPPYGAVLCHAGSHVWRDECGAPEFFSGGAKLITLPGADGKLHAADVAAHLAVPGHGVHHNPPTAISLSQLSECGTVYTPDEIAAIAGIAHGHGLKVHMDGSRLANAVITLGITPAEITWRVGVDILSFGASKNGAIAAEAVVAFDRSLAESLGYRRKRGGHLLSKMRFLAAQFDGYLTDDRWRHNAAHANAMARRLIDGIRGLRGITLRYPVEGNEIFVAFPEPMVARLHDEGFLFHPWPCQPGLSRLVTSFQTPAEDVDAFVAAVRRRLDPAATP